MVSMLLGTHPPILPVRSLVGVGELFGIAEGTTRVALSRMAAEGEVISDNGSYHLGPRFEVRRLAQDRGRWPEVTAWDGTWEIVLCPTPGDSTPGGSAPGGRGAEARSGRDAAFADLHLAPASGLTWMRPGNLVRSAADRWPPGCRRFVGRPEPDCAGDVALARSLWDLDGWAGRARALHGAFGAAPDPAGRFTVAAAVLRHLRQDPVLPAALTPVDWPADDLRAAYELFTLELRELLVATTGR